MKLNPLYSAIRHAEPAACITVTVCLIVAVALQVMR